MNQYRFTDATGYSLDQLTEMHNASFEGYYFPLTMTPQSNADLWRIHQIDATRCVVMHDTAGAFVGMARMGTRGARGWCGGFGVVPAFRGRGAGHLLAAEMVRVARESGLERLQLEVLTQNTRALHLYEVVGFTIRHRLVGLEINADALSAAVAIQTETMPVEALLHDLHPTPPPCWGREPPSLLTMRAEATIVHTRDGAVNGVVMRRAGDKARVEAVVLADTLADAALAGLLRRAAGDAPAIQVYNEPEGSPFLERCRALGFREVVSQLEMVLTL